jgi:hypothetical protein
MTYHHNKSHYIIKYIHKYVNYKFGAQGLINQVYYAMNDQRIGVNQILIELKEEINKIQENEGDFICDAHQYIPFFSYNYSF